jgi:hypothetical protein
MTEQQWLACTDATPMLHFVRDRTSARKLRLFACACCRRIWSLLRESSRRAVETAERLADHHASKEERAAARAAIRVRLRDPVERLARRAAQAALNKDPFEAATSACAWASNAAAWITENKDPVADDEPFYSLDALAEALSDFAGILRDLIDPSFYRPGLPFGSRWPVVKERTVVLLAQAIYDDRAFDRLPILADALEDEGCTDALVLSHCRQPAEHTRGCWLVDALLSRS